MTRESSSFKMRTLLTNCCRRQAALFALSIVSMLAVLPIGMILTIQTLLRFYDEIDDKHARETVLAGISSTLYQSYFLDLLLIALAVVAGIGLFRYLHSRSQTDFFYALPIKRGQIFAVRFLTGLLAVVPAYLIGVVLSCVVCAVYGYGDAIDIRLLGMSVAVHLIGFLLVYAVSILAAVLCGHTLVALLMCAWLQFGVMVGWIFAHSLLNVLYPARAVPSLSAAYWTSPPAGLFRLSMRLGELMDVRGSGVTYQPAGNVKPAAFPALVYLIAAAVILLLSYILCRIRKGENAGLSIAFPLIEQPLKLYMVAVVAIACGLIFEMTTENWPVMFLGMALGGFVAACVVEVVYDLDFHSIFRRWKSLLVFAVLCAAALGCMAADVTHWNSTIPDRAEVDAADLTADNESWDCSPAFNMQGVTTGGTVTQLLLGESVEREESDGPAALLQSEEAVDAIYDSVALGAEAMKGDRSKIRSGLFGGNTAYQITLRRKDGKLFRRTYYLPDDTEQLAENGAAVRFSKEYKQIRTAAAQAEKQKERLTYMMAAGYHDAQEYDYTELKDAAAIKEIVRTVYDESQTIAKEYAAAHPPVVMVRVMTKEAQASAEGNRPDWNDFYPNMGEVFDIPVYASETKTLKLLQRYAKTAEPGFGDLKKIHSILVTSYDEESDEMYETVYRTPEEIEEWCAKLVPVTFSGVIDPVCPLGDEQVTVSYQDGTEVSCSLLGAAAKKDKNVEERVSIHSEQDAG